MSDKRILAIATALHSLLSDGAKVIIYEKSRVFCVDWEVEVEGGTFGASFTEHLSSDDNVLGAIARVLTQAKQELDADIARGLEIRNG